MTDTMKAYGELLTASEDDRVLTYLLLPFGEEGRTNRGRVTASAGVLSIPDRIVANLEHDRTRPVATSTAIAEEDRGLVASFRVANTTAGNDLLAEAAEGLRTGISVELDGPVVRDGKLLAGTLTGAGFVTTPAFPSAQLVAADAGELPDDFPEYQRPSESTSTSTDEIEVDGVTYVVKRSTVSKTEVERKDDNPTPAEDPESEDPEKKEAAVADSTLTASAPAGSLAARKRDDQPKSVDELFASLAKGHATGDQQLLAALDQGVAADLAPAQESTWAGEIWKRRTHRQRFIPLFTPGPLNALKITGWKFAPRTGTPPQPPATPTVGTYSGYPAEPTSTEVKTGPVTINAARLAGANEFDRGFVDFDTPEFWAGFYRESANDLSRKLDTAAETHLLTAANYTEVEAGAVPVGVATAAAFIVDGFLAIQDIAMPDFAVIGVDLWREFVLTRREDALEYLEASLSLDPAEGRLDKFMFIPSSHATVAGKVLVGASDSHTFYGPKTVRAQTINIANGGVQDGLFGYYAANTGSAEAFALVGDEA